MVFSSSDCGLGDDEDDDDEEEDNNEEEVGDKMEEEVEEEEERLCRDLWDGLALPAETELRRRGDTGTGSSNAVLSMKLEIGTAELGTASEIVRGRIRDIGSSSEFRRF